MVNRRELLAAAAVLPAATLLAQRSYEWGGPVLHIHLQSRTDEASTLAHINGSGVTKAVLLTRTADSEHAKELVAKHPDRFVWFLSADVTKPESAAVLTKAVKDGAQKPHKAVGMLR